MLAISWPNIELLIYQSTQSLDLYKAAPLVMRHLKTRQFLSKYLGLTNERRVVYLASTDSSLVAINFIYDQNKHVK